MTAMSTAHSVALTLASWAITFQSNYWFAQSIGVPLSYWEMTVVSSIAILMGLVPITVMGAGTRDLALILILGQMGQSRTQALALSTLFLSCALWLGIASAPSLLSRHSRIDWRTAHKNTTQKKSA